MNKLVRVFLETDMRCQHAGLRTLAAKAKVKLSKLNAGEHVVFVNKARNRVKLYSNNGVISYLWKEKGMLDMAALAQIPYTFQQGEFDMKKAVKMSLMKRLGHEDAANK